MNKSGALIAICIIKILKIVRFKTLPTYDFISLTTACIKA